jgi:hypothetical protein
VRYSTVKSVDCCKVCNSRCHCIHAAENIRPYIWLLSVSLSEFSNGATFDVSEISYSELSSAISLWLYNPFLDLGWFFSFLILLHSRQDYLVGRWARLKAAHPHSTALTQNKRTQISMLQMGFEPTIPVLEGAKTVHALDRVATVIGRLITRHV